MSIKIFTIFLLLLLNICNTQNQDINQNQNVSQNQDATQNQDDNQNQAPNPNAKNNILKTEAMILMEEFSNEWESKMEDFKMEYLYYIPLDPRDQEEFFENITTVPTTFRGAFFLSDETTNKVEFYIKDSLGRIIYQANGHYNIFNIQLKKADKYTIIFKNSSAKDKIVITFTVNTGQNNLINSKDLSKTEKKMDNLESVIKKFNMEFKLSRDIHIKRYQSKLYFINIIYNFYRD